MKSETLEEFLARGGVIKKVATSEKAPEVNIKSMAVGPAVLLTLEEGELFYGEKKASKVPKTLKEPKINFDDLPEPLRKKLLARSKRGPDEA
jgi:hypothetical protein